MEGELAVGEDSDRQMLNERLQALKSARPGEGIAIDVLQVIGKSGFDALQVTGQSDEVHHRRLHRFREQMGRAVPITCSDAHSASTVFLCGDKIPHVKLPSLSASWTPEQVFSALRDGAIRHIRGICAG